MFQWICTKVVVPYEIGPLRTYVAKTLCMLEIWFPPSFFDLMTHLLVHIVDELEICGPLPSRWGYPMERYLVVLKNYVWNKAKPKGCMQALGYIYDEALGFWTKHFTLYPHNERHMWDLNEEEHDAGEVLHGMAN
jgi:hypothetical protein